MVKNLPFKKHSLNSLLGHTVNISLVFVESKLLKGGA